MRDSTCCVRTVHAESHYGHEVDRTHICLSWKDPDVIPVFPEIGRLRAGFPALVILSSSFRGHHFAARPEQVSNP
jgi:hypothetical protein